MQLPMHISCTDAFKIFKNTSMMSRCRCRMDYMGRAETVAN